MERRSGFLFVIFFSEAVTMFQVLSGLGAVFGMVKPEIENRTTPFTYSGK